MGKEGHGDNCFEVCWAPLAAAALPPCCSSLCGEVSVCHDMLNLAHVRFSDDLKQKMKFTNCLIIIFWITLADKFSDDL